MNRLKYVLGIHVPHPVSPGLYKRHHSEVRLLKTSQAFLHETEKPTDCVNLQYEAQLKTKAISVLRNKPKSGSSKKSLDRNGSVEGIHKRRNSIDQFTKPPPAKRSAQRHNEKETDSVRYMKTSKFHKTGAIETLLDDEPRSYAQIIASYNEKMHSQYGDSLTMINGIHRSPFSTASLVSLKMAKDKATKKTTLRAHGTVQQNAKFSSGVSTTRYDCRNDHRSVLFNFGENEIDRTSSYASMIEKYSNALSLGASVYANNNTLVPRRNVSTKLDDVSMTFLDAKEVDNKTSHAVSKVVKGKSRSLSEVGETDVEAEEQIGWITRVEDIINDLKLVTATKEASESHMNDRWILQSVNERADWLDRVVKAHRRLIEDKKTMFSKSEDHENTNESFEMEELQELESSMQGTTWKEPRSEKSPAIPQPIVAHEPIQNLQMSSSSKKPSNPQVPNKPSTTNTKRPATPQMTSSTNKPTNPISQYISREPTSPTTPPTTPQTPTNVSASTSKQPQIELRMTPSQNESVVSINVDELAAKQAGAKDQLSVVISSSNSKVGKTNASNMNMRSDFGSMQISISENTVPVKQIEFSINGKPVSELKSIVARADKLDVVSSMDKVEIRIPSSKERAISEHASTLTKTATNATPVLNLQIAAKFNEPRVQHPRDTGMKTETSTTPNPVPPPSPPKQRTVFTPSFTKSEASTPTLATVKKQEESVTQRDNSSLALDARELVTNQETMPNVAENKPASVKTGAAMLHNVTSDGKTPIQNPTSRGTINIEAPNFNKNNQDRTPSNAIPWWSSEESFKKIKKKNNNNKSASEMVKDVVKLEPNKSVDNVVKRLEQELSPGVIYEQQCSSVESLKPAAPVKDVSTKKALVEEKEGNVEASDSNFQVVRVRSPSKRMAAKPTPNVKTLKYTKAKMRYRLVRNNDRKTTVVTKELDATASVPHSPKVIKYVSVSPHKVEMEKKSDAGKTPSKTSVDVEQQRTSASKVKASKVEKDAKADTQENPTSRQGSTQQAGKANVQNSQTIFKETNLEKPVNKSAGVSAKSSLELTKGRKQDKTDRTVEKSLPRRSESVDESEDQRFKKILKSMKPIEKRKDGTLIDYGVTVPSRKSPVKFKQTPIVVPKPSIKIDSDKVVTVPATETKDAVVKIVEPQKVSSVKEQALTKPESVSTQVKIVESEKISPVQKESLAEPKKVPTQEKIVEAEKVLSVKKETLTEPKKVSTQEKIVEAEKVLSVKKETLTEPKKVSTQEKIVEAEKILSVKKEELREPKEVPTQEKIVDTKVQPIKKETPMEPKVISVVKVVDTETIHSARKPTFEVKKLNKSDTVQHQSTTVQPKETPKADNLQKQKPPISKTTDSEKNNADIIRNVLRNMKTKKAAVENTTRTKSSPENLVKTGTTNLASTSKSSISNKTEGNSLQDTVTPSRSKIPEKLSTQKDPKLPESPRKTPFEGTIVRSTSASDRKTPIIDRSSSLGRASSIPPQKPILKKTKDDSPITKQSPSRFDTRLGVIKTSSSEKSIEYYPRNEDSLKNIIDLNRKKVSSEAVPEKENTIVRRKPSNKGGGSTGSGGLPGTPIGPAGAKSSMLDTVAQVSSNIGTSISTDYSNTEFYEKHHEEKTNDATPTTIQKFDKGNVLFTNAVERSDKEILYSSWLQRFKGKYDNGKIV